jgi:hydroxypyruvate isomerase
VSPELHQPGAGAAPGLRLAANLKWLFTELPFLERFDAAAEAGFTGVEFASPYDHPAGDVRRALDAAGLTQVLINTPAGAPSSPTRSGLACIPDQVAEFRDGVRKALEYASVLGSPLIHVMGGIRPEGVSRDRALATYVTNVAWAAQEASSSGVTVVLEAINRRDVPRFVLDSVDQAVDIIQAVGEPGLRLLFDVYHCQVGQGDLTVRLTRHAPFTAHVQVADAPFRTEPGTGEIGWEKVFATLRELSYAGWIGCEYTPTAGTLEGLGWRSRYGLV